MPPKKRKQLERKVKLETKVLGYCLIVNAIIWINIVWYNLYKGGNIDACTDLTKYTLAAGIILLLGRKAISEIIVKAIETTVKK